MSKKPRKISRVKTLTPPILNKDHLLTARLYLAQFEPNGELSQDGMAEKLGCSVGHTYSKWERMYHEPPSILGRACELLIINALYKHGRHAPNQEPTLDDYLMFHEEKVKSYQLTGGTQRMQVVRMRSVQPEREIAKVYRDAYDFFSECTGVDRDGYLLQITGKNFRLSPAFNVNGKIRGAIINLLELVLCHLAGDKYEELEEDASSALISFYRENGYNSTESTRTAYFRCRRVGDDLQITPNANLVSLLNPFLAQASEHIADKEAVQRDRSSLAVSVARIIQKMPEVVVDNNGAVEMKGNTFTTIHGYSANFRLKTLEINTLEKALCVATGTDPTTIKTPATILTRQGLLERVTGPIRSHFMNIRLEGRSINYTLHEPNVVQGLNELVNEGVLALKAGVRGGEDEE